MPNGFLEVAAAAPNLQSYTVNGDGTVADNVTGLMWRQIATEETFTWSDAKTTCPTLTAGGAHDWRLPSFIELLSIVDYSVASPAPAIDDVAFPNTPPDIFWSSTKVAGESSEAWYVNFSYGYAVSADQSETHYVRCVR